MNKASFRRSLYHRCLIIFLAAVAISQAYGQTSPSSTIDVSAAIERYRTSNEKLILEDFIELLSLPNVASNIDNIRRNADLIESLYYNAIFQFSASKQAGLLMFSPNLKVLAPARRYFFTRTMMASQFKKKIGCTHLLPQHC